MPLLNLIGFSAVSYSYSLAILTNLALCNSPYLIFINSSSAKNRVLLVCKPTIPKGLLLYKAIPSTPKSNYYYRVNYNRVYITE